MKIDVAKTLDGGQLDEAWRLYEQAFTGLNAFAVQRHLMYRSEFDGVAADVRIQKWLALDDDGTLLGLATYTNDLAAWPLVSEAYFARRWPEHFAEQRIWYCGYVAVPSHRQGVFGELVEAMYVEAALHRGIICLDVCRHNEMMFHLPQTIERMLSRISNGEVRTERADTQSFFTYETAT